MEARFTARTLPASYGDSRSSFSVLAHSVYDAIALGGMVNPYVGSISTFVLIYFCVKMHKFAKEKIIAQIERDRNCFNA